MAVSNLLALIDDVATLLDDVAAMTKVAGQKTAGVLGDDLALNAQQVVGVTPDRELPIVWAVFKGSLVNKLILVPTALLLSAFLPVVIQPLLMLGGAFLCFEGAEKVLEKLFSKKHPAEKAAEVVVVDEKKKIRGAVTTDFILSAEIIAITLGIVQGQALLQQTLVLSVTAIAMTFFVYGIVAGIVKIDDFGLYLGIAFQLQDDLLDVFANQEKFGKKIGGDIVSNKKTFLLLKALELSSESLKATLLEWIGKTEFDVSEKVTSVTAIYNELGIKEITESHIEKYYQSAIKNLNDMDLPEEKKEGLFQLAAIIMNRDH